LELQQYLSEVSPKERENITTVMSEISLEKVLNNPVEHHRVKKVIDEIIQIFQDQHELQHYEAIAMVKMLQDMIFADCYEPMMEALDQSTSDESFIQLFLNCKR